MNRFSQQSIACAQTYGSTRNVAHTNRRGTLQKRHFIIKETLRLKSPPKKVRTHSCWIEIAPFDSFYIVKFDIDLKMCNLSEDLAPYRSKWRIRIHVANSNIVGKRLRC